MQPSHRQTPHTHAHTQLAHAYCIQFTNEVSWQTSTHTVCGSSNNSSTNWNFYIFIRRISFNACNAMPCCAICVLHRIAMHGCVSQKMLCASHVDVVLFRFVSCEFCLIKLNMILWAKNLYSRNGFVDCFFFLFCVSNVRAYAKIARNSSFAQLKMLSKKCRLPQNGTHETCAIFSSSQLLNGVFPSYSFAKV